jgi:hypothetical protein
MTYQPAGSRNLFLSGLTASGISGYKQLTKPPMAAAAEVELTQAVIDTGGEVLMDDWVSPALGLSEIAAGSWTFELFGSVDTVDGVSEVIARVYARSAAGSETELFHVTTGSLTAASAGYLVTSSQGVLSLGALTDRLVVKIYAKTTSTGSRTVHFYYLGAARQSRLSLPVELAIVPGGDMLAALYDTDLDGQISGGSGHTVQDEGVDLTARSKINFKGAGVSAADNAGTGATDITIPGGNVDPWIPDTNTWSYSSADSPTFVISVNADMTGLIGVGYRIKLTQTTAKFFIVTAVGSYSGGATLITVYGGTDYTLANAAVSSPCYSLAKAPLGFPMDPAKWTEVLTDANNKSYGSWPGNWTWCNCSGLSKSIPIGAWKLGYKAFVLLEGASTVFLSSCLSTSASSDSDKRFTETSYGLNLVHPCIEQDVLLTSKTTYYVIHMAASGSNFRVRGDYTRTMIWARCAYL